MFGSDSSRRSRRGRAVSVEVLAAELAELRTRSYVDQLEVVRLGALVNGLTSHIDRLSADLHAARNEAQALRMMPATVDPRIEEMAREILQLRDVIAAQQTSIMEMTSRVGDLLVQVAANAPVGGHREEPAIAQVQENPDSAHRADVPVMVMAAARPVEVDSTHNVAEESVRSSVDDYAFAVSPVTVPTEDAGSEFDDATLRRLRLIRQAFEN